MKHKSCCFWALKRIKQKHYCYFILCRRRKKPKLFPDSGSQNTFLCRCITSQSQLLVWKTSAQGSETVGAQRSGYRRRRSYSGVKQSGWRLVRVGMDLLSLGLVSWLWLTDGSGPRGRKRGGHDGVKRYLLSGRGGCNFSPHSLLHYLYPQIDGHTGVVFFFNARGHGGSDGGSDAEACRRLNFQSHTQRRFGGGWWHDGSLVSVSEQSESVRCW